MRTRTTIAFALFILLGSAEPLSAEPAQATLTASARVIDASAATAAVRAAESLFHAAGIGGETMAAGGLARITVLEDGPRGGAERNPAQPARRVVEIAFVGN